MYRTDSSAQKTHTMFLKAYYIHFEKSEVQNDFKWGKTSQILKFFCVLQVCKKNSSTEKMWDGSARQVELRTMFQACWDIRMFTNVYRNCLQSPEIYL